MASSVQIACIWCVLFIVYVVFGFARLVALVYFVYVDGFFCSIRVHVVCFVYNVCWSVLLALLVWFHLYMLMTACVQCVCIWCVLFTVYLVLFCPSC